MAAVAVVGACNDFLDREPLSQISPEAYYNTEAQLNAAVLRLYQSGVSGINYWADNNTDDMAGRTGAASKYTGNLYKTALGDGNWTFDDIYHINYCLEQVLPKYREGKISGADANIRHYIGEMYFLRAMQYFSKYSEFGDFPIVRNTLPDKMDVLREASVRSPRNEVARFILSDLDSAIFYMGTHKLEATRATSDVCRLLKSRVALFEGVSRGRPSSRVVTAGPEGRIRILPAVSIPRSSSSSRRPCQPPRKSVMHISRNLRLTTVM